jgi:hypothetical protein
MVDQSYLLDRKPPPGDLQRRLHQSVMPALINTAGVGEAVLERVADRVRRKPLGAVIVFAILGMLLGFPRGRRSKDNG